MFVNSDFSDLLKLFNANEVRYLVIGGYAVIQYAEPRFTKDKIFGKALTKTTPLPCTKLPSPKPNIEFVGAVA
jgi:hypothetical protein